MTASSRSMGMTSTSASSAMELRAHSASVVALSGSMQSAMEPTWRGEKS
jgi:hypothetical protein